MPTETEDFFERILPNKGFPVVVTLKKGTPPQQFACPSLKGLLKSLVQQDDKCIAQHRDLYFGVATLEKKFVVDAGGKFHTRIASNCKLIRSLILDVDTDSTGFLKGDGGKPCYASKEEALSGVAFLCDKLSFSQPFIIDSGNGLHVYWPFEEAIETDAWMLLAARFKAACTHIDVKLVADPSRLTDRSSILRVPGSFNFKNEENPLRVRLIQTGAAIPWPSKFFLEHLDNYIRENGIPFSLASVAGVIPKVRKSLVDLSLEYPDSEKADFKDIYKKCNWFNEYMQKPAERTEPQWMAAIDLSTAMKFVRGDGTTCQDEALAIYLSKSYPGYKEEETLEYYERAVIKGNLANRKCLSLEATNRIPCSTCKFKDHVTTPLQLPKISAPVTSVTVQQTIVVSGEVVSTEEQNFPKPPFPYEIGEDGGVYMRRKDDSGNKIASKQIYEYTILPVGRTRDETTDTESVEIEVRLPHGVVKRFSVPGGTFQEEKTLKKILGDKGVLIQNQDMKHLVSYLIAYAKVIQRNENAVDNYTTFGWKNKGTDDVKFILYDSIVKANGVTRYRNTATSLRDVGKFASSQGSLQAWKDAFAIYNGIPDMEPHIINLMLSFGAPLLTFLDEFGLIYNLHGSGGEGKSSSLYLATSIWGKPAVSHAAIIDTTNALLHKLGTLSNIPMAFDELTNVEPRTLSDFAYGVAIGRAKDRLRETGEARLNNLYWQTFVLSNSNYSLYGKLSELKSGNSAHGYRILEYPCPKPNREVNAKMTQVKAVVKDNYGIAGREFMRYVLANYTDVAKKTRLARDALSNTDRSRERFWVAGQACMQVAGYITKELGLHDYEPGLLLEYMKDMTPRQEVQSITGDPIAKLNDYMMQNLSNTVKVLDDKIVTLDLEFKGLPNIAVRLEGTSGEIYKAFIPTPSIERWCKMNGTDYTWLRTELTKERIILRNMKKRIGAGTKYFSLCSNCWELDMQHPLLTGVERREEGSNVVRPILGEAAI